MGLVVLQRIQAEMETGYAATPPRVASGLPPHFGSVVLLFSFTPVLYSPSAHSSTCSPKQALLASTPPSRVRPLAPVTARY